MRTRAFFFLLSALLLCASAQAGQPAPGDFQALRAEAESLLAEGSHARALALYESARDWDLDEDQARWRDFRIEDARWRAEDAVSHPDDTAFREAGEALLRMVRDVSREEEKDRTWAEIQEALGDFYWMARRQANWAQAWNHYRQALDWWAGAPDLETARERYLGIAWKLASPAEQRGAWRPALPLDLLDNLFQVVQREEDRARAALLLAEGLISGGTPRRQMRIEELFEQALAAGRTSGFHDDALMSYATWLADRGRPVQDEQGTWRYVRDYKGALALYRRLLDTYAEGESRHVPAARARIEAITRVELNASVAHTFLPDSEIEIRLHWRNVDGIELALHRLDLTQAVRLRGRNDQAWLEALRPEEGEPVRGWRHDTAGRGDHEPGSATLRIDALPVGAYLLTAGAGERSARELVLVTDLGLVLKTAPGQALAYVCDAFSGAPVEGARVVLWRSYHENRRLHWESVEGATGEDGLLLLELPERPRTAQVLVFAAAGQRQAFSTAPDPGTRGRDEGSWRLYVFSDRPAYRPEDTVHWKVIARRFDGQTYSTPAGETLEYILRDPRGGEAGRGQLTLNEFGAAWTSFDPGADLPLGMVRIEFLYPPGRHAVGSADLFRLEEYKLPEFRVTVEAPLDEEGAPRSFLPGEEISVTVRAEYYFGGPLQEAEVEMIVREHPFTFRFPETRPFPWLYGEEEPGFPGGGRRGFGGPAQVLTREQVRLDENGEARLTFTPPERGEQDREYRVEARVTDASRREILASGAVRVTRQRYYVQAKPEHWIHRPGDQAVVGFQALDPNGRPVRTEGRVRVVREREYEVWTRPDGRELFGEALRRERAGFSVWPPPGWRPRRPGREREELLSMTLPTDGEGRAELRFVPEREGYYRVFWSSPQQDGPRVQADTLVWAADRDSTDLGARVGRLQLIADRDTFRAGEEAAVLLVAPSSGRHVLFSVEAEDLMRWELVRMEGTVKLLRVPIGEQHIPNAWLSALLVQDAELHQADAEMVVPPLSQYLDVTAEPADEAVRPGEPSTWTLTVRDREGDPVEAELAFSLTDESVFYIQDEIAGDPRAFFFEGRRSRRVATRGSFQEKPYRRLDPRPPEPPPGTPEDGEIDLYARRRSQVAAEPMVGLASARGGMRQEVAFMMVADQDGRAPSKAAAPAPPTETAAGEPEDGAIAVRTDFRATAFWQPGLRTDAAGKVSIEAAMPESLTAWRGALRAVTRENRFGFAEASIRTRLPLMARLQAPRFLVAGDEAVVSLLANNQTDEPLAVVAALEAEGVEVLDATDSETRLTVPPGGEARVDWRVRAVRQGEARLRVSARGEDHADAMERTLPVHEHGIERAVTLAGKVDADRATLLIDLPAERRAGSTSLHVQVTPSLATALLDALPYLAHYPYGCTEQTMSRFLPAVIVARTFERLGLSPEAIEGRLFGGIERPDRRTHPAGKGDLGRLDAMVRAGLERLYDFQHGSGGWGWWKEGDTDPFMSAYVTWGLALAGESGVEISRPALDRGREYLRRTLVEYEQQPDLQTWMLHALSAAHGGGKPHALEEKALDNLWERHPRLNAYARALLALAAHRFGQPERARVLARNLENGVRRDDAPDTSIVLDRRRGSHPLVMATAHWGETGIVGRWSEGGVEATAFALQALLTVQPDSPLVEPVMNWLVKNRRGAQWSNTRDTAIVILAFNDYLLQSGELARAGAFRVSVNGAPVAEEHFTPETIAAAPGVFEIDPALLRDGENRILIEREGQGPLYVSARAVFFSLECPIPAGGHELFVRRRYYRYVGRPTLLKGLVYDRVPLREGDRVRSGDRIETVLTVEAKNHYEYLVFEDLKPAGFEAVEVRSGGPFHARELRLAAAKRRMDEETWADGEARPEIVVLESGDFTGRDRWVYREFRDRHIALFVDRLPQGVWEMRYQVRAETPGLFHALPVTGHAMYVPELRCNSGEHLVPIDDRPPR